MKFGSLKLTVRIFPSWQIASITKSQRNICFQRRCYHNYKHFVQHAEVNVGFKALISKPRETNISCHGNANK